MIDGRYAGLNGLMIRNELTTETRLDVLRALALDPRRIVAEKARGRLARLGAALGDGELDNTGTYEGPVTPDGFAVEALALTPIPADLVDCIDDISPPPVLGDKPVEKRKRTATRKNLLPIQGEPSPVQAAEPTTGEEEAHETGLDSSSGDEDGTPRAAQGSERDDSASDSASGAVSSPPASEAPVEPVTYASGLEPPARKPNRPGVKASADFIRKWESEEKRCPSCLVVKDILAGFGPRRVPGTREHPEDRQIPQPWCRICRSHSSRRAAKKKAE